MAFMRNSRCVVSLQSGCARKRSDAQTTTLYRGWAHFARGQDPADFKVSSRGLGVVVKRRKFLTSTTARGCHSVFLPFLHIAPNSGGTSAHFVLWVGFTSTVNLTLKIGSCSEGSGEEGQERRRLGPASFASNCSPLRDIQTSREPRTLRQMGPEVEIKLKKNQACKINHNKGRCGSASLRRRREGRREKAWLSTEISAVVLLSLYFSLFISLALSLSFCSCRLQVTSHQTHLLDATARAKARPNLKSIEAQPSATWPHIRRGLAMGASSSAPAIEFGSNAGKPITAYTLSNGTMTVGPSVRQLSCRY